VARREIEFREPENVVIERIKSVCVVEMTNWGTVVTDSEAPLQQPDGGDEANPPEHAAPAPAATPAHAPSNESLAAGEPVAGKAALQTDGSAETDGAASDNASKSPKPVSNGEPSESPPEEIRKEWYILKVQSNREESIREGLMRRVAMAGLER
jgi:hypothetical protein